MHRRYMYEVDDRIRALSQFFPLKNAVESEVEKAADEVFEHIRPDEEDKSWPSS
jgi:hypothetical protein